MATHSPVLDEWTAVPRALVRLPLELRLPDGFAADRPETWPRLDGRLEFHQGRLLFMPPGGDAQQRTTQDLSTELGLWQRSSRGFAVGSNEAGMLLGGDVRAADAAVWRQASLGPITDGFPRVPPVLAAEVAGRDDTVEMLLDKARWYLNHGVEVVWILIPKTRSVRVVTSAGSTEYPPGARLAANPSLPGLEPRVDDLFRQLSEGAGSEG